MTALGIDYGAARIGVARELSGTSLVVPLATVSPDDFDEMFVNWLDEYQVTSVYVGLPISLAGHAGKSATDVKLWTEQKREKFPNLNWYFVDERMTSATASQSLKEAGLSTKEQKGKIDAQAAVLILELGLSGNRYHD